MATSHRHRRMMDGNPMRRPGHAMRGPGRRRALGVALGMAGIAAVVLAIALGPLATGSFGRDALFAYAPERLVLGLVGIVAAAAGWILCGSDDVT